MAENDYTKIEYQSLLDDFTTRIKSNPKFAKMSSASIYFMFVEMLCSSMDFTNFYMQRTAEEASLDTAKLDSSVIKLAHNLGYNPRRAVPAQAEFKIRIQGPLPSALKEGSVMYLSRNDIALSFNSNNFMLDSDYSYTFTQKDIDEGKSSSWVKEITLSKDSGVIKYNKVQDIKYYNSTDVDIMKVYQCELVDKVIYAYDNIDKIGTNYQSYDINDLNFSNWYGIRDPFAYYQGKAIPKNGITKIGIGINKESALADDNLFEIEDISLYNNSKLLDFQADDETTFNETDEPLKVCDITTNSDKSVRISFGDGLNACRGISNQDENIYIQYIKTNGKSANKTGTTNSTLQINSTIYATQQGSFIDLTNNISIIFNSDIMGGCDFESAKSIRINAPRYYSSQNRLVNLDDYRAYFATLTTPIDVQNSYAISQETINENTTYNHLTNTVLYSLASNMYKSDSDSYAFRNVLIDGADSGWNAFSLYGSGENYLARLNDYTKILYAMDQYINSIGGDYQSEYYNKSTELEQWQKNIKSIYDNIKYKMMIGTKIYSIPPIVHYYDVVGSVEINSLKDMQSIKNSIENKVYEWLNNNTSFSTPIYKSNIIKFFNENSNVNFADLDIRVSDLIKSEDITFNLEEYCCITDILEDASQNSETYETDKITLPINTIDNINLYPDLLKNKSINLNITYEFKGRTSSVCNISFTPKTVNTNKDKIILIPNGIIPIGNLSYQLKNCNYSFNISLSINANEDFYSQSTFDNNTDHYTDIINLMKDWYNNSSTVKEANRSIPLPYYINLSDIGDGEESFTRAETIMRKGTLQTNLASQLSEKSFFQRLIPAIIIKCFCKGEGTTIDSLLTDDNYKLMNDLTADDWDQIDNLTVNLYRHVKATLSDSVLDDNNNIVNYSLKNEIPVINVNVTYQYKKG